MLLVSITSMIDVSASPEDDLGWNADSQELCTLEMIRSRSFRVRPGVVVEGESIRT